MPNENQFISTEMTIEEKFKAVDNLKNKLEDNFLQLGQLLAEIKKRKLYLQKGYKTFKEFIENEYKLGGTFANKLVGVHEVFVRRLDLDEGTISKIGIEKLHLIKPLVAEKDIPVNEQDYWVEKAQTLSTADLRDEVKDTRAKQKVQTMKEVYIEQHIEKMCTFFSCSVKELNFMMALYFQDRNLDFVKVEIRELQRKFEEQDGGI